MNIFYAPELNLRSVFSLDENESKHCIRVLRHRKGDIVCVVNGRGVLMDAEITDDSPKQTQLKSVGEVEDEQKRNYKLHLAVALPKNPARFEWLLEKCTEIGVDEITPMICARSEKIKLNDERMQKILIEAMKQSLKSELPKLNSLEKFETLLSSSSQRTTHNAEGIPVRDAQLFIASCEEKSLLMKDAVMKNTNLLVLIGPEGDFTNEELEMAKSKNMKAISLGKSRLRIETAAVVACNTAYLINQ